VPSASDSQIEALCARIRVLCGAPLTPDSEAELRKLAGALRIAIAEHVKMAKSSLSAKKAVIDERDSGSEEE
jgi:hypothetical protein